MLPDIEMDCARHLLRPLVNLVKVYARVHNIQSRDTCLVVASNISYWSSGQLIPHT